MDNHGQDKPKEGLKEWEALAFWAVIFVVVISLFASETWDEFFKAMGGLMLVIWAGVLVNRLGGRFYGGGGHG